jgi:hypothetical protein
MEIIGQVSAAVLATAFAFLFAATNYPGLAVVFSMVALGAAAYAVRKVNELGKALDERADEQRREIEGDDG